MGFCLFSFSNFTFEIYGFHLKKLTVIDMIFELARGRKFLRESVVLKTGIYALVASLLGQMFVLRTSNSVGKLSADSSSTETLYCLNKNLELGI